MYLLYMSIFIVYIINKTIFIYKKYSEIYTHVCVFKVYT